MQPNVLMAHNLKPHPGLCASIQYRLGIRALADCGMLPSEAGVLSRAQEIYVCVCRINQEGYAEPAGGPMVTTESWRHRSGFDHRAGNAALPDDEFVRAGL